MAGAGAERFPRGMEMAQVEANEETEKEERKAGFNIIDTVNKDDAVDPDKLTKPIFFFYGFCTCMIIVAITSALIYWVGTF